jgi:hypothetical protein
VRDERGEHAIVRFYDDEGEPLGEPGEVVAFGEWLFDDVNGVVDRLLPYLAGL